MRAQGGWLHELRLDPADKTSPLCVAHKIKLFYFVYSVDVCTHAYIHLHKKWKHETKFAPCIPKPSQLFMYHYTGVRKKKLFYKTSFFLGLLVYQEQGKKGVVQQLFQFILALPIELRQCLEQFWMSASNIWRYPWMLKTMYGEDVIPAHTH